MIIIGNLFPILTSSSSHLAEGKSEDREVKSPEQITELVSNRAGSWTQPVCMVFIHVYAALCA